MQAGSRGACHAGVVRWAVEGEGGIPMTSARLRSGRAGGRYRRGKIVNNDVNDGVNDNVKKGVRNRGQKRVAR